MEFFEIAWLILVFVIGLNGFAAGVAAILHAWRHGQKRATRTLIAAISAGLFPFSWLVPTFFSELGSGSEAPLYLALGGGVLFAIATAVSFPAAIVVSRKLEAPGDQFRTFE
jgi:hypothetical protein